MLQKWLDSQSLGFTQEHIARVKRWHVMISKDSSYYRKITPDHLFPTVKPHTVLWWMLPVWKPHSGGSWEMPGSNREHWAFLCSAVYQTGIQGYNHDVEHTNKKMAFSFPQWIFQNKLPPRPGLFPSINLASFSTSHLDMCEISLDEFLVQLFSSFFYYHVRLFLSYIEMLAFVCAWAHVCVYLWATNCSMRYCIHFYSTHSITSETLAILQNR